MSCASPETPPTLDTDQLIEDIRILSSDEMQGRLVGTEGNAMARAYIINRFEGMGLPAFRESYAHEFSIERNNGDLVEGTNVIGIVEGKSDSMIVITAHYDHLGVRDSLIFNGADDNASGTSGLLAMADYFTQITPNHTLVFAALDAEEGGLNGARAFVRDSSLMEKVVLNINMDMISQNDKNELYAVGTYHYPELKPILETIDTGELSLLFGHDRPEDGNQDWTFSSDHGPFHQIGIPFIYFGVEDHEHYHRPTDTFETVPQDFYKKSVQLILNAVFALDNH
ncbi:MAG: M28 family peptidase [Balneolaceae bacterium]|nr:M28 family peptidase [Balneolaceae bacterium]MBO6544859.1 M28 family peptidase [Balneolaceae bacterium]MBO6646255.1 M28 family peptidase [Balneolaceae bacterium]